MKAMLLTKRNRSRLMAASLLVLATFLLSGCGLFKQSTSSLDINFRDYLPVEWTPIDNWHDINIDEDETLEHLLFYRYESGQVGGVIYDPQTTTDFAPTADAGSIFALPGQPSVMMIPYRLLPSYWKNAGQGVLAAPGQTPTFIQVQRPANEVDQTKDANKENKRTDELIVFGDDKFLTRLSIFWWRDAVTGYGVTHLDAPGGLIITDWDGKEMASTIMTVDGYTPERDNRSFFCHKVTYRRSMPEDPERRRDDYRFRLSYEAEPRGLTFCPSSNFETSKPYPTNTFYPEATALAYLLHPQPDRANEKTIKDLVKPSAVEKVESVVGEFDRVKAVTFYTALTEIETSAQTSDKNYLVMQVVAELIVKPKEEQPSPNTESANAGEYSRFVTFFLEYQRPAVDPAKAEERHSDRWLIIDALDP